MPAPFDGGSYSVAEEVANGDEIGTTQIARERNLDIATVFRWIVRGLPAADGGRVRLEAVKRGKTWLTSRAALRRFFLAMPTNAAVNAPKATRRPTSRAVAKRERDSAQAREELRTRHGI